MTYYFLLSLLVFTVACAIAMTLVLNLVPESVQIFIFTAASFIVVLLVVGG